MRKNLRGRIKRLQIQLTDGDAAEADISHNKNESHAQRVIAFRVAKSSTGLKDDIARESQHITTNLVFRSKREIAQNSTVLHLNKKRDRELI
jgi:hypothetical protein